MEDAVHVPQACQPAQMCTTALMSNKFSRAPISFLICACFLLLLRVILLFFTLTPLFASDLQIPRFTSQQVKDRQHVGFVKDLCRRLHHNSAAATKQSKSELKFI